VVQNPVRAQTARRTEGRAVGGGEKGLLFRR
jgi:hypothetical protein